mmetsp:Transcript_39416/g.65517  ORF Transcript_39416/g.65517 Transcript_39416/m.65517 type:complete len:441 (+) Transcript_39416:1196-2518(+)
MVHCNDRQLVLGSDGEGLTAANLKAQGEPRAYGCCDAHEVFRIHPCVPERCVHHVVDVLLVRGLCSIRLHTSPFPVDLCLRRQDVAQHPSVPRQHRRRGVVTACLDPKHAPVCWDPMQRRPRCLFSPRPGWPHGPGRGGQQRRQVRHAAGREPHPDRCRPALACSGAEARAPSLPAGPSALKHHLQPPRCFLIVQRLTKTIRPFNETNAITERRVKIHQLRHFPTLLQPVRVHVVHHWLRPGGCALRLFPAVREAEQIRRRGHVQVGLAHKLPNEPTRNAGLARPKVPHEGHDVAGLCQACQQHPQLPRLVTAAQPNHDLIIVLTSCDVRPTVLRVVRASFHRTQPWHRILKALGSHGAHCNRKRQHPWTPILHETRAMASAIRHFCKQILLLQFALPHGAPDPPPPWSQPQKHCEHEGGRDYGGRRRCTEDAVGDRGPG